MQAGEERPFRRRPEALFLLTALGSLAAGSVWLAGHARLLLEFYYAPALLALTHLYTLGFATAIIMGVLPRLLPLATGIEPPSARLLFLQYVLFAGGASWMLVSFARGHWRAVAWGTLGLVGAGVIQAWSLGPLWRRVRAGDAVAAYVACGLVHFLLAAGLGALYAAQNGYGIGARYLTAPFVPRLAAHVHLAGLGWVSTTILGIQLKLVPTTRGAGRSPWIRLVLLQCGILGLAACLLLSSRGAWLPAALILAALGWHASGPLRWFRQRRDWRWEAIGLAFLVALGCQGCLLVLGVPGPALPLRFRLELAYGYVALHGWILLTVAATAFKLFPLWVWQERFRPHWGRVPVPAVVSLWSVPLRDLSGLGITAGTLGAGLGMAVPWPSLLQVSLFLVLAGVTAFLVNLGRVLRWVVLDLEYRPPPEARLPRRGPDSR